MHFTSKLNFQYDITFECYIHVLKSKMDWNSQLDLCWYIYGQIWIFHEIHVGVIALILLLKVYQGHEINIAPSRQGPN